jgi:hypothetical protein
MTSPPSVPAGPPPAGGPVPGGGDPGGQLQLDSPGGTEDRVAEKDSGGPAPAALPWVPAAISLQQQQFLACHGHPQGAVEAVLLVMSTSHPHPQEEDRRADGSRAWPGLLLQEALQSRQL